VADAYRERDVVAVMEERGRRLAEGANAVAASLGIADHFAVVGRPSCEVFLTRDHLGRPSQEFRTLFLQEMLERGILGQSFVISAAHTDDDVDRTVEAVAGSLTSYAKALEAGSTAGLLRGRPVAPALRRFAAPREIPRSGER
jgi:glutamate-1-semialdehyde 2,1-aminomutase